MNKEKFNVGMAITCGIEAAVIVDKMVGFCKCAERCPEYRENGKLFVEKEYIYNCVMNYIPKHRFDSAIKILLGHKFIESSKDGRSYSFTDLAKGVFAKKPYRISIYWQ